MSQTPSRWFLLIFPLLYLSPLFNIKTNLASYPGDPFSHTASLPWFCESFFTGSYQNYNLFAPQGVTLALSYDYPLLSTLSCLVYPLGMVAQFNFLMAVQVYFILLITYWASGKWLKNPWLQFSFVLFYTFSSYSLAKMHQYLNLLTPLWAFPLIFTQLYFYNPKARKSHLFLGLSLGLAFASGWLTLPLLAPLLIILYLRLIHLYSLPIIKPLTISLVIAGAIFFPFAYPMLSQLKHSPPTDWDRIYTWNADLLSYLIPWKFHATFPWFQSWYQSISSARQHYFETYTSLDLGLLIVFAILLGSRKVTKKLFSPTLLIILSVYLLLSFGPYLSVAGVRIMSLPYYDVFTKLPVFSLNRGPARYALGVHFILLIFIFTTLQKSRFSSRLVCAYALLATTALNHNLTVPYVNYHELVPRQGLQTIKNDPQPSLVLHLPLALQSDQSQNFLQRFHTKPIPSGHISYLAQTPELTAAIANDPLYSTISCSHTQFPYQSSKTNLTETSLNPLLKAKNIHYVIVNETYLSQPECAEFKREVTARFHTYPSWTIIDSTPAFTVYALR